MPRLIAKIIAVLVLIVSIGAMAYPAFSDWWNTRRRDMLQADYEAVLSEYTKEDFSREWAEARAYNDRIHKNDIYGDVFSGGAGAGLAEGYESVLNIAGNGVMGYISIPKISVYIPIYHGVDDEVLQKGAGHMPGTKLPIGGPDCNAVIAAHRGLPSERLFTDIDQLGAGDIIELHILDEILYYRVEHVWAMVDKYDVGTMEEAMSLVDGEDHVTLFTCTPYGVNSHRLIVRGERYYPSPGDDLLDMAVRDQGMLRMITGHNIMSLAAGLAAVFMFISLWHLQGYMIRYNRIRKERSQTAGRLVNAGALRKAARDNNSNIGKGGNDP